MIIIGIIAFAARSAPQETQIESSMDTQLMLYGEDFLSILDLEAENHRSWLYDRVNVTFGIFTSNSSDQWNQTNLTERGVF